MVSHQYRCIFVEIPKTGSTSIRQIVGFPEKPHLNICQIAETLPRETFEGYFKFAFVRNPWDRAVSLYERREGRRMKEHMSFAAFIDWMTLASATCIHPLPHRYQLDWLISPHGDLLVDFVGRFESLAEDWRTIARRIGAEEGLPHANRHPEPRRHYTEYYTPRTIDIVQRRFAVDIEYFGYRFGG